jgi:hypothetical protein
MLASPRLYLDIFFQIYDSNPQTRDRELIVLPLYQLLTIIILIGVPYIYIDQAILGSSLIFKAPCSKSDGKRFGEYYPRLLFHKRLQL